MNDFFKEKADCCGCTACEQICNQGAISMQEDAEGFFYPHINRDKCTNCGLCQKVCSFHGSYVKAEKHLLKAKCMAAVHKEEKIQKTSRSGGAFMAFAEFMIKHYDGIVYGVALDDEHYAHTVRVSTVDSLKELQGSKYVQSDKKDSFRMVRADLSKGKKVLYSGTPCEVSGLLSFLEKSHTDTSGLTTCDIVCHGTPSPCIWSDNIRFIEKKHKKIRHVEFRDKVFGWRAHIESYQGLHKKYYANVFTTLFYKHLMLRPSCSTCHFCNFDRCGDVTIGDCWGVEKRYPSIQASKGVSLLLINSAKGEELLEQMGEVLQLYPLEQDECIQPNLMHPSKESPRREKFWMDYQKHGYRYVSFKYYDVISLMKLVYNIVRAKR